MNGAGMEHRTLIIRCIKVYDPWPREITLSVFLLKKDSLEYLALFRVLIRKSKIYAFKFTCFYAIFSVCVCWGGGGS